MRNFFKGISFFMAAVLIFASSVTLSMAGEHSIDLSAEEVAFLDEIGTVRICVDPDWYPFEFIDDKGNYIGIAADLLRLIGERAGVTFELVPTGSWTESIEKVKAGEADVLAFLNETPERSKWLSFTAPYFNDYNAFITHRSHDAIRSLSALDGETVVLPEGTSIEEYVRTSYPNLRLVLVETEAEALERVMNGEADLTIRSLTMAAHVIKTEGLFDLKIAGQMDEHANFFRVGVRKDYEALVPILDKAIETLTLDDVTQIVNKHVSIEVQGRFDYKLFFVFVGAFLAIIALGGIWIQFLRRINRKLTGQQNELMVVTDQLRASEALYKSILSASPDAVVISDMSGKIIMTSKVASEIVGFDGDETPVGYSLGDFVAPEYHEQMMVNIGRLMSGDKIGTTTYEGVKKDGTRFVLESNSVIIQDDFGAPFQMVSIIRDVTETRRMQLAVLSSEAKYKALAEELELKNRILNERAIHDKLTGIRNRVYFDQRIIEELDLADRYENKLSLLFLDLDNFKYVNDTFGHDVGDQVLIKTAETINRLMRKTDIFARWGGEEFVILMTHTSLDGALIAAEKVRQSVEAIEHPEVGHVTISIGVSERQFGERLNAWFKRTDKALYQAKKEGRNRVVAGDSMDLKLHFNMEWQIAWDSGHPLIDKEHRMLLEIGNEMIELALNKADLDLLIAKMDELIDHVMDHFVDEERILFEKGYEEVHHHVGEHKMLIAKAKVLKRKVETGDLKPMEAFEFIVSDVIMDHMLQEDVKYFGLMKREM